MLVIAAGLDYKKYMIDVRKAFLNARIGEKKRTITINQRYYTKDVVKSLDLKDCNPVYKAAEGHKLSLNQSEVNLLDKDDKTLYYLPIATESFMFHVS